MVMHSCDDDQSPGRDAVSRARRPKFYYSFAQGEQEFSRLIIGNGYSRLLRAGDYRA
jgi:hypothetical protein